MGNGESGRLGFHDTGAKLPPTGRNGLAKRLAEGLDKRLRQEHNRGQLGRTIWEHNEGQLESTRWHGPGREVTNEFGITGIRSWGYRNEGGGHRSRGTGIRGHMNWWHRN